LQLLLAHALAPAGQRGTVKHQPVLEELLAAEELVIGVLQPALAQHPAGEAVADDRLASATAAGLACPRTPRRSVVRGTTCSMSMIASSRERKRSVCPLSRRSFGRIVPSDATKGITSSDLRESRKRNCKLLRPHTPKACNLKCPSVRKIDSRSMAWEVLHGRLHIMRMNDVVLPRTHSLPYFSNALCANASAFEQADININPKLHQRLHLSADVNALRRILFSRVSAEHLFALEQAVALYDEYQQKLSACDMRIEAVLKQLSSRRGRKEEP
jgi:hypothetical protein